MYTTSPTVAEKNFEFGIVEHHLNEHLNGFLRNIASSKQDAAPPLILSCNLHLRIASTDFGRYAQVPDRSLAA